MIWKAEIPGNRSVFDPSAHLLPKISGAEPAPEQQLDCAQKFGALFGVGEITQHERVNQYFDFSGGQIEVENEGLLEIQFDSIPFPEPDWFPEKYGPMQNMSRP